MVCCRPPLFWRCSFARITWEVLRQNGITDADAERIARAVISQMGAPVRKKSRSRKEPDWRNTVIYAAIMLDYRGPRYCDYLDSHGLRPKWRDSGPNTYRK